MHVYNTPFEFMVEDNRYGNLAVLAMDLTGCL